MGQSISGICGGSIMLDEQTNILSKFRIFVTSDLHLEHENIIRFCKRPFLSVKEMNETLVKNWNKVVGKKDLVYYLGDLVYNYKLKQNPNAHKERFEFWLSVLNGRKILIRGNHDPVNINLKETLVFKQGKNDFFLCHEPEHVPKDWKGWAICGHHHNNKLGEYPFIDKKNKKINVSTELTEFRPVNMNDLIKKIEE